MQSISILLLLNRKSQFVIADVEFLKIIAIWTFISVSEFRVSCHINYKL